MNPLFVQFENDPVIYTFYVANGNKLSNVIFDIEKMTNKTVNKASYNKF